MIQVFKEKNILFVVHTKYYFPTVEIKDFTDQPVKNDLRTYNIQKIAIGQGDDYTTDCLLDYIYFKKYIKW